MKKLTAFSLQVILDKDVPARYLNELKSVLVSALASNGQILDALKVYDEIKRVGGSLEPKAVISLIVSVTSVFFLFSTILT